MIRTSPPTGSLRLNALEHKGEGPIETIEIVFGTIMRKTATNRIDVVGRVDTMGRAMLDRNGET